MLDKDLHKLSPLVKDKISWDAFMFLLELEEQKIIKGLSGKPTEQELIRISAQYNLIQSLKNTRTIALDMEKNNGR